MQAQKDMTSATRAVQSAVEQLARSERDVTTAQREALAAQQAINAARETAAKRIRDQALDLETAQLDQKDAAQAVTDAQNALNAAQGSGNTGEIAKAQEAYDRAKIAAEQANNKVADLTETQKINTKTGVEGSDEVVQAKQREADATPSYGCRTPARTSPTRRSSRPPAAGAALPSRLPNSPHRPGRS
jgi:vacuolar-type H+-ATPase subunit I/STV1